ncbi:MAG: hypothetical protein P0S95_04435 [Rhabdochlamydiaceae bacterium]|nr:hypothetical protein [Candidatus Amphrikana amoebophyrae]
MSSISIQDLYSSTGLVLRTFNMKSLQFEVSGDAAIKTSCATFITQGIPIKPFYELKTSLSMGLLYYTDRIHLVGAFKKDAFSPPNINPHNPLPSKSKNGKNYVSFGNDIWLRNYESISGIAEKVMRMHKKNPTICLELNELLITALDSKKSETDHIAGVVVSYDTLEDPKNLLDILKIIKEKLPGRNLYLYHFDIGEISEIATDLAIAVLYNSTRSQLQTEHANLVKLRSRL